MFNTKEVKTQDTNYISSYLAPGHFLVKVNNVTVKKASTGNSALEFEFETEPITTEGFKPVEGHTGKVGRVKTVYISNPDQEKRVATILSNLAEELGVKDQVDNISADLTIEQYAEEYSKIVCNSEYVWISLNGEEYARTDNGKKGISLRFPSYRAFCSKTKYDLLGAEKALSKTYIKRLPEQEAATGSSENVW
jgi:hypothetical protein